MASSATVGKVPGGSAPTEDQKHALREAFGLVGYTTSPGGGVGLSAGEALELRAYTSLADPRGSLSGSAAVFRPTVVAAAVQSVAAGVPILGGTTWYVSNVAANGFALGNDSNSGLSKALPKLTLAAAHDAAAPGDTIIINSSETFYDSEFFSINKSLS